MLHECCKKIIEVCEGKANSAQIYYSQYSKAIFLEDLKKHFHHKLQERYQTPYLYCYEEEELLYQDGVNIKPQSTQN